MASDDRDDGMMTPPILGRPKPKLKIDPDDNTYQDSMVMRKAHDEEVRTLINQTIETLSAHFQWYNVGLILENCHAEMTNKRDEDVMNTVVRDAEYYFVGRAGVAQHKWQAAKFSRSVFESARAIPYDDLKMLTSPAGQKPRSHLLESQDRKWNSPSGGSRWALIGAGDGMQDDPNAVAKPKVCTKLPFDQEREHMDAKGDPGDVPSVNSPLLPPRHRFNR
jgi:hypothetical protein